MKRSLAVVAVVAAAATLSPGRAVVGQDDGTPRQLRVVWAADPATRATVSWTTAIAGTTHRVHYDVVPRGAVAADYAHMTEVVSTGEVVADGPFFHHAALTDLPPDTPIYFAVESDGALSRELWFRTAPGPDATQLELLYGGDSRTGRRARQAMNQLIARLHGEDPDIVALVHGGDYIGYANDWGQWSEWLDDHELTFGEHGRVLPIVPAKGNHEGRGVVYNRVFGEPSGDPERNWFFTTIGNAALVTLDTEVSLAGDQREWLRARLIEGREQPWLLVSYHRPAFPAVKSPSGAREHWVPLFEEFDVDLVLESDGHALKRTPPIRGEQIDFTGVTYVGEGGLGVPQRTPVEGRWYLESPGMASRGHHVQKIELTPDLLRYQAVLLDGTVADEVTILPRQERLGHRITALQASAPTPNHIEIVMSRPFDPVSAVEAAWALEPAVAVTRVELGAEVGAVLAVANTATAEELDEEVGLDARAARNIVAFREGPDGQAGTDDDRTFATWQELDAVAYVGESALTAMSRHALAHATNEKNVITLRVEGLEEGRPYRVRVGAVADRAGQRVEDGTTVPVVYTAPDDRADAITQDEAADPQAGCATAGSGAAPWALFGVVWFWRRRRQGA